VVFERGSSPPNSRLSTVVGGAGSETARYTFSFKNQLPKGGGEPLESQLGVILSGSEITP
jgi:hypothetical protein